MVEESPLRKKSHSIAGTNLSNARQYQTFNYLEEDEGYPEVLDEWGSAPVLFLNELAALVPILLPLIFMIKENLTRGTFLVDCSDLHPRKIWDEHQVHEWYSVQAVCACSWSCTVVFPYLAILNGCITTIWRLLHLRAFYALFEHKMYMDLETCTRVDGFMRRMLLLVLLGVLVHLAFDDIFDDANDVDLVTFPDPRKPIFQQVEAKDGIAGFEKRNPNFIPWVSVQVQRVLVPAVTAMVFFFFNHFEASIVPLVTFLRGQPVLAKRHLEMSIEVDETTLETIVCRGDLSLSRNPDMADLCNAIRRAAYLEEEREKVRASPDGGEEGKGIFKAAVDEGGRKMQAVSNAVFLDWWTVHFLVKSRPSDPKSREFLRYLSVLLWLCAITSISVCCCLVYRVLYGRAFVQEAWWMHAITMPLQAFSLFMSAAGGIRYTELAFMSYTLSKEKDSEASMASKSGQP
mmetsp:Transcript_103502/g.183870  ORF Transcript_103502/g.183870 Transcript_103502/m.183870 type:complete len:460 (-) Transcript_103502:26-1405(-)|eukprot:CAMPEP_0197643802 /NCGR_PEP_ID=MMETSP1338-20131121/16990_1 /TAXON_ID=43686 ORGANISM="Pelagodinium beii, Strain RCC1491" /NCGR_SAMPLE_ID=MMETSP1338 /ASSEMBLY_ACC=CAM_ASM_000754 /LENGTH=459 /DNA_ID=CAMNT_0043217091 /DNA_START=108 /DNA_END=1487 /DNA_ORIENTATION=-